MSRVFTGTFTRFLLLVLVTAWLVCRGPLPSTATSPPSVLASLSAQTMGAQADQYLSDLATEAGFSGAVLMARQGEILLSAGYGEADRDRHRLKMWLWLLIAFSPRCHRAITPSPRWRT